MTYTGEVWRQDTTTLVSIRADHGAMRLHFQYPDAGSNPAVFSLDLTKSQAAELSRHISSACEHLDSAEG